MLEVENKEPSRLGRYLVIMKILGSSDSLTEDQIMQKTSLSPVLAKEYLRFLVKLDLIEEICLGTETAFSITSKGERVIAYFGLVDDESEFFGSRMLRID